ncbi:uncharacterized protein A4U43_C07F27300 [Asparagus officinalis]|uniref:Uncharacterized protein n=1 Tax=Asparagus officinalis TaxID=4686 RepID=A0A5P1EFD5_ASPOF|nr:uncharacterized protein A4U43_C07F27300 [Asparagus officinalis]
MAPGQNSKLNLFFSLAVIGGLFLIEIDLIGLKRCIKALELVSPSLIWLQRPYSVLILSFTGDGGALIVAIIGASYGELCSLRKLCCFSLLDSGEEEAKEQVNYDTNFYFPEPDEPTQGDDARGSCHISDTEPECEVSAMTTMSSSATKPTVVRHLVLIRDSLKSE